MAQTPENTGFWGFVDNVETVDKNKKVRENATFPNEEIHKDFCLFRQKNLWIWWTTIYQGGVLPLLQCLRPP